MASLEDIENLKALWLDDPSFDLEEEFGFEDHFEELRDWRLRFEDAFEDYERLELEARARHNGRTIERQAAIEESFSQEQRYKTTAIRSFKNLYGSLGLRRSDLTELLEALVEDLVFAAVARMQTIRLKDESVQ